MKCDCRDVHQEQSTAAYNNVEDDEHETRTIW